MNDRSTHLTNDQFAECLTAEYTRPEVQAHLASCDSCRMELGVFMASMDDFSQAALGWSRAKHEMPKVRIAAGRSSIFAPLQWGFACLLAAGVSVPVALHVDHAREAGSAANGLQSDDSASQIAQDNRLMQSVDRALGQSDPSPFLEYHLVEPESSTRLRVE